MKVATLAIIRRDNQVLLGFRKTGEIGQAILNGPGGKCEPDESPLDCVIRETKEEVGIELDRDKLEKVAVIIFHVDNKPAYYVHVFRTSNFVGEPVETVEMVPEWYHIDHLPFNQMFESDRAWWPRALGDEVPFRAKVYYHGQAKELDRVVFCDSKLEPQQNLFVS